MYAAEVEVPALVAAAAAVAEEEEASDRGIKQRVRVSSEVRNELEEAGSASAAEVMDAETCVEKLVSEDRRESSKKCNRSDELFAS